MKRSMGGGAARGPVAHGRQRRTIRLMQILLVVIGVSLLVWAGSVLAELVGGGGDGPRRSSIAQPLVLGAMAAVSLAAASLLGGRSGVRLPTPARLDDLVGRAEAAAAERSETHGDRDASAGG